MHIKRTAIMAVLTFMGVHLAEARKPKLFESPEHNANSTALLNCLASFEKKLAATGDLVYDGKAELWDDFKECGNVHWEIGDRRARTIGGAEKWTPAETYEKCKKPVYAAAQKGSDWFKCALRSTAHESIVAWSPLGMRSCYKKAKPEVPVLKHGVACDCLDIRGGREC